MTTRLFLPPEPSVKTWLLTQSSVVSAAPGGIFVGTPSALPETQAWLTFFLLSDPPRPGGTLPSSFAHCQFDAYAPESVDAMNLAYALITACESLVCGTQISSQHTAMGGATVTFAGWRPEGVSPAMARYGVDVLFGNLIAIPN